MHERISRKGCHHNRCGFSDGIGFATAMRLAEEGVLVVLTDAMVAQIPAGRFASASEIAAAVAFLASEDANFCNGTSLIVDGGQTSM